MWQILEPNIESVRRRLAAEFGCDTEELAITRNASEALQIAQLGIDLKAGRRGRHDQPGLRAHARHLGSARPPRRHRAEEDLVSRCRRRRSTYSPTRLLAAITPTTKVLHFCHITNLTGQIFPVQRICDEARRARHPDDRRRRARLRALPVQARGPRVRLLRHEPAQVAARADRHRLPLRAPRAHRDALAADAGRRDRKTTTSASSRRSARTRRRTTTRSPRRSTFHEASAASARRRGCATCATAGRRGCKTQARIRIHTNLDPAHSCAIGTVQITGVPTPKVVARLWDQLADHRHADRARGVRGRARDAERLHHARGSGHVRRGDGRDRQERRRVTAPPSELLACR